MTKSTTRLEVQETFHLQEKYQDYIPTNVIFLSSENIKNTIKIYILILFVLHSDVMLSQVGYSFTFPP